MANKNPVKQTSVNSSTFDIQDNTLVEGTGISITTSTTEGSKNTRTIKINTGTTNTTACVGNDSRLRNKRTPIAHANSTDLYGLGTNLLFGHVKLVDGDLNGLSYKDGEVAAAAHTHSQYQTKLTRHHHVIYLYGANYGEFFIDWWANATTAYTDQNMFLHALWDYLDGANPGEKQYLRISGLIKSGSNYYTAIELGASKQEGSDEDWYYYLDFMYTTSNNTSTKPFDIESDSFTIFSDIVIE
jgi:hypothetical protein